MGSSQSNVNKSTLAYACQFNNAELVKQAIISGANDYNDAFHIVCLYGYVDILPILCEYHDIRQYKTCDIQIAACRGHLNILEYIESIAPGYLNSSVFYLLSLACLCNQKHIVEWLIRDANYATKLQVNVLACIDANPITYYIFGLLDCAKPITAEFTKAVQDIYNDVKNYIVTTTKPDIAERLLLYFPNVNVSQWSDQLLCDVLNKVPNIILNADIKIRLNKLRNDRKLTTKYSILSLKIPDFDDDLIIPVVLDYVMYDT